MAKRKTIVDFVTLLAEAFNRECKDTTFDLYYRVLADVPEERVVAAFNITISSNRQYMPTPGQLRELAVTGGIGYVARAERAWLEFDRAVVREGADHTVSFADGLINATVRLLGDWIFCASRTGDDYGVWLHKLFLETYQRLCQSGAPEDLRQPLMGTLWAENALHYSDEQLAEFTANGGNVGLPVLVKTSQPVLLPPTEAPKRISAARPTGVPRIELQKVN